VTHRIEIIHLIATTSRGLFKKVGCPKNIVYPLEGIVVSRQPKSKKAKPRIPAFAGTGFTDYAAFVE